MSSAVNRELRRLMDRHYDAFSQAQSALYVKWDLEGCRQWELVPEAGVIGFEREEGGFVVADIQIIGSFIPSESIWSWAWAHDGLDGALKVDAMVVRRFGEERGFEALTEGHMEASPMLVGGLMALTVHLTGSEGIWEGHDEGISVMIAMRNLRIERSAPGRFGDLY